MAWLLLALQHEVEALPSITRLDMLAKSQSVLKARLFIGPELFVQVYRSDRFETTNLALIHMGQRLYGRDQLAGEWHRHNITSPDAHDSSSEGRRSLQLSEFLDEVESILTEMDLP